MESVSSSDFQTQKRQVKIQCAAEYLNELRGLEIEGNYLSNPDTGEEYLLRRGECVNVLPGLFRKLCPFPAIVVEEEAWLNRRERCLRLHCYNLTWSKYASLEEFSTYRACDNNLNWTSFEQRGSISVNGVGSLIGGMMEGFAQTFLQRGANKGFCIMEDLIMTMSGRYTEA